MSAPAKINADLIAAFIPWVAERERDLHRRLLFVKKGAASRARQCVDEQARGFWWAACDIAGKHALEPYSRTHLEEVLRIVTYLQMCADSVEHWGAAHG